MASREGKRFTHQHHENLVPLAALLSRETRAAKMEKPIVRYGEAAQSRKGEDYLLIKTDTLRVPSSSSSAFSVFAVKSETFYYIYHKICFVITLVKFLLLDI